MGVSALGGLLRKACFVSNRAMPAASVTDSPLMAAASVSTSVSPPCPPPWARDAESLVESGQSKHQGRNHSNRQFAKHRRIPHFAVVCWSLTDRLLVSGSHSSPPSTVTSRKPTRTGHAFQNFFDFCRADPVSFPIQGRFRLLAGGPDVVSSGSRARGGASWQQCQRLC